MDMIDKIWQFAYTDCIHESAMAAISLHKTKKGAETAMYLHKEQEKQKWLKLYSTKERQKMMPFGTHEEWGVYERELLE